MLPDKDSDFSAWYNALVRSAKLIEDGPVRGTTIFRPYGYSIWENIRNSLDIRFKKLGTQNVYFPLLLPVSYLSKEAEHVEGFAKECAVVTHSRLTTKQSGGKLIPDPDSKLEEQLIIRPTSESLIWATYKKWIASYRDLPIVLNQWANVVRWEMRTRPFLRTTEILWQEGHTAHTTSEEANNKAVEMQHLYADFIRKELAIPMILGVKSSYERFAGAKYTYTLEGVMQDGKALQLGTSHFLGQNFAKAFDVQFSDEENKRKYVWGTSWGVTTRLIGAVIMTHSDKKGLILPPKIAPQQVVLLPILKNKPDGKNKQVLENTHNIADSLRAVGIRVHIDQRTHHSLGWKINEYELQGVPLRIVLGERDLEKKQVELSFRDTGFKEFISINSIVGYLPTLLEKIQDRLYKKAELFQKSNTRKIDNYSEFIEQLKKPKPGFILAHWDGTTDTEKKIKKETGASIRCLPLGYKSNQGSCIYSGNKSIGRVIFAKAY